MDQLVHWNQLLAHALSFLVFLFLVRGAFNAIIYPPMRERRERIKAEFDRIEAEKGEGGREGGGAGGGEREGGARRRKAPARVPARSPRRCWCAPARRSASSGT